MYQNFNINSILLCHSSKNNQKLSKVLLFKAFERVLVKF